MPIIYKAYKEEDGRIVVAEAGSDLDAQLAAELESVELPGLEQETSNDGQANETEPTPHDHPISEVTNLQTELDDIEAKADSVVAHTTNTTNPHSTTITQAVAADADTDITVAEMEELTTGGETELHKHKQMFSCATRIYGYSDERWVAASTLYGFNYILHNQNRGTGATPSIDWTDMGILLPAGATLKRLVIKGRANSTQFTDIQVYVRAHDGDYKSGDPIDSSAETPDVEVLAATNMDHTNSGTGNMGDMHMSEISLGDYQMQNDGDVHIYFRPVGNLTSTRYLYVNFFIEYTL